MKWKAAGHNSVNYKTIPAQNTYLRNLQTRFASVSEMCKRIEKRIGTGIKSELKNKSFSDENNLCA